MPVTVDQSPTVSDTEIYTGEHETAGLLNAVSGQPRRPKRDGTSAGFAALDQPTRIQPTEEAGPELDPDD